MGVQASFRAQSPLSFLAGYEGAKPHLGVRASAFPCKMWVTKHPLWGSLLPLQYMGMKTPFGGRVSAFLCKMWGYKALLVAQSQCISLQDMGGANPVWGAEPGAFPCRMWGLKALLGCSPLPFLARCGSAKPHWGAEPVHFLAGSGVQSPNES